MTIDQLAQALNKQAVSHEFLISTLPELRKKYLHKKQLSSKIFTWQTIKNGKDKYAFHNGGRDEIQFNVGEEFVNRKAAIRYALCFSLEASKSLHDPVEDLKPFRDKFNKCIKNYPKYFGDFEMWYYQDGKRNGNFKPQAIPDNWFKLNTFICLGNIIKKSLSNLDDRDVRKILSGFDELLPIYEYCVLESIKTLEKIKIFTRLTSNENHWELPTPHRWKKENQGKKNIPFENQYGFGHEEWLLNPRYHINGFQYGYIRGIQNSQQKISKYDEVHLYTVKKEKTRNLVYYLGFIKNVYSIKTDFAEQQKIRATISRFQTDMFEEVANINGDLRGISKFPFQAVVKFRREDLSLFEEPIYQANFDLKKFKRFQPYKLNNSVEEVFESEIESENSRFVAGKSTQNYVYNRTNSATSSIVTKIHSEIIDALEIFLKPNYSLALKNISIETTRFNGNIADVVTKEADSSINIYEIKTSVSGRRNLRDSIAQLLDYSLHSVHRIKKLFIVSPIHLGKAEVAFLDGLKTKIDFPLEYLCYQKDGNRKFIYQ